MRLTRYRFGEFELDPASRELWRDGALVAVPLKSLECLAYLVAHRERAVGRDELVSAVWGRADVSDTVITQTMRRARKALDDAGNRQSVVRTIPGFGYRWVAPVEQVDAAREAPTHSPTAGDPAPAAAVAPDPGPRPHDLPASAEKAVVASRPYAWIAVGLLLLVLVAAGSWWIVERRPSAEPQAQISDGLVMVMPVAVEPNDREYSWVRLGAMEYAADRLRGAALKVTPTEQTLHLSAGGRAGAEQGSPSAPDDGTLQQLRARGGAQWILLPSAQQDRGRWRVRLRALGRGSEVRVEAQGDSPLRAMAVATDAWLRRIGRATSAHATPTPLQERLQRIDAELDAGQLEAAREQIAAAPRPDRDSPRMRVREGQLEYRAGRIDEAKRLFERALEPATATLDSGTRAKGLMGMGAVALRQGQLAEAEDHYTQAVAALREADDAGLLGNAYNGRGVARVQRGDIDGAVSDLGLARVTMQQNGDAVSAAMVGSNLGRIEARRNHWPQAIQEYDNAIAVFERYQVRDYLAATLAAKAAAQLALVQPRAAGETIGRAQALAPTIEDDALLNVINATLARIHLQNGRLDDAERALRALPAQSDADRDGGIAGLSMALAMGRGDRTRAADLARRIPTSKASIDDDTVLIAVQAAADERTARAWRALLPATAPDRGAASTYAAPLADALVERRFGTRAKALAAADDAVARSNRDGSPDDRVRAGVVRALVLLESDQSQTASAVLGELDAYVDADYRVAWLAWTVYRHGDDRVSARRAAQGVDRLRGQRSKAVAPVF